MSSRPINYLYNFYTKDDGDGQPIVITIDGHRVQIGINVILLPEIHILSNPKKSGALTIIGSNSFIGYRATIIEGETYPDETIVPGEKLPDSSSGNINVVLCGDDFGRTHENNVSSVETFEKYKLHHLSLMVNRGEDTAEAVGLAKKNGLCPNIGFHFNVTEGYPLSPLAKEDWYSVNQPKSFARVLTKQRSSFFLLGNEKRLLKDELRMQIKQYRSLGFTPSFFDSHGNVHFKWPVAKLIVPILQEAGFTHVRIPRDVKGRHPLYRFFFKRRVLKLYRKHFSTYDTFLNASDILNSAYRDYRGKTIEVMVHPYIKKGRAINRRDVGFDALLSFFDTAGIKVKGSN